ncbi:hypothetical protein COBT_001803 [Conglomerata obtusa]
MLKKMFKILVLLSIISCFEIGINGNTDTVVSNLTPTNNTAEKSNLVDKENASPVESDLIEKINHVVDDFNNYRDNFLIGKKSEMGVEE